MFIKANIYSNREQFDRWTRLDTKELRKRREFYLQILSDNQVFILLLYIRFGLRII